MNKTFFIIIVSCLFCAGCNSIKQPVFKRIDSIALKGIDAGGIMLESKFIVENNNTFNIKVLGADVDVFLDGTNVGKLTVKEPFTLYAGTESAAHCTIMLNTISGSKFGLKTIGKITRGEIPVELKGNVDVKHKWFKRTIAVNSKIN